MPRLGRIFSSPMWSMPCAMCGIVLGCALQLCQPQLWPLEQYLLLGTVAVVGAASTLYLGPRCGMAAGSQRWTAALCWLVVAAAMAGAWTGARASWQQRTQMPPQWEGRDVRVRGVLVEMPHALERGWSLRMRIDAAWSPEGAHVVALPPLVQLSWYGPLPAPGLQAGQHWEWTVRLKAPHAARNPHASDGDLWLWSQGVQATGYVRHSAATATAKDVQNTVAAPFTVAGPVPSPPSGAPQAQNAPVWLGQDRTAWLAQWRGQLHARMHPPAQAPLRLQQAYGVVQALVTGAQSSIAAHDWQLFRDTGVAHLVSISGLHITMFAWLAMRVVQLLWRRSARACLWLPAPLAGAWCGWGLALAYAVFSGWGIPAQRTIGMLLVVVVLRSRAQQWPWPMVWLLVLGLVVLWQPWSLWQAGFWLSFVAVGILFAAQPKALRPAATAGAAPRQGWRAAVQALARLWHEQWVVGLALAPLTLVLFGQISLLGLLANMLAIPWVTLVVTPLAMLGVLWPVLWLWAAYGVWGWMLVLEWGAQWSWAVRYFAQPAMWAAVLGLLSCLWMALPVPWRWRLLGVPTLLPLLGWQPTTPQAGDFDVLALDVGQGSAVLLRTQRHSLLFDAGPRWSAQSNAGERLVVPLLRAWGVRLNAMVISHADSDHAGGQAAVLQAQPQLLQPPGMQWGHGGTPCQQGQQWQWDGVQFMVLHPAQAAMAGRTGNAQSCVLRVVSASGTAALLTGDMEVAQEQALLAQQVPVQAALVVVPHHGSATSSSASWLQVVQPQVAMVQAGYRNRFQHPVPEVMARYSAQGAQVVISAECGAAYWHSVQPQQVQCERQLHQRYWQRPAAQQ